ncbi:UDP-N-acetylmuramoylalanyl-D-glutamate--2,6-diaminopimelate ligase [hydrothermal vent metagenome]|uniref:UDP-N-acetylmuramoylalanyl-D-glutamate--2,6-diaminopimelate ligase n=1 Tax=hydrothermal vent metagenome TaxID=652676 RepID=A0A3B1ADD3_9ZZZZ
MMTVKQQSFSKTLSALLTSVVSVPVEYDVDVNNLQLDSRQVKQGDVFIAIQGEVVNGMDYIDSAIKAGAVAILWEAKTNAIPFAWSKNNEQAKRIPLIAINDLKLKLGGLASLFYGNPSAMLDIVAVTGTNGKTSCVNFIAQSLGKEKKCGLIGTLGIGIYPGIVAGLYTTPDVVTMHKTLADFVDSHADYAAVEVSSHALAQGRVDEVRFDVAVFTNLTQDHLDYHGTMDDYLKEKIKLFQMPNLKTAIVNVNDRYGLDIIKSTVAKNIITYGIDAAINSPDIYATDIQCVNGYTEFVLNTKQGFVPIVSSLVGDFNISNLLAISAYLQLHGYSLDRIAENISTIESVAGRMQKINVTGFPLVIIDYAHTPDALKQVLDTLSKQFKDNLTCVFGCGGERDKDKRSKMGEVASTYADTIVLTNDNPRGESAEDIIKHINQGIGDKAKVIIELDRKKALELAIKATSPHGCVLVAGKGHEDYQIIGNTRFEFNDVKVVEEILSEKQ